MSPIFSHISAPPKIGLVEADRFGFVEKPAICESYNFKWKASGSFGKMVRITQEWMKHGELTS